MDLSVLKLRSPRRRFASGQFPFDYETGYHRGFVSGQFPFDYEAGYQNFRSPVSPFSNEDHEMVFEQHQAAIPFIWEEKPGTPRRGVISSKEEGSSGSEVEDEEDEESETVTRSSSPSSRNSSIRETDESWEFEFSSSETSDTKSNCSRPADELFANGQILPLKPPPRLQSIKQLLAAEAAEDVATGYLTPMRTPGHSFRKDGGGRGLRTPTRSFRKDGLKAFIPSPRREKPGEQVTTMLGFEEWPRDSGPLHRRVHSLSKLPALFLKKSGFGKENVDYWEKQNFDGDTSARMCSFSSAVAPEKSPRLNCYSSRTLGGSFAEDDLFESSRSTIDLDASKSEYFNASGRTILEGGEEEESEDRYGKEEDQQQQQVQPAAAVLNNNKNENNDMGPKKEGKLIRFFIKKPSRFSAVAPTPSPEDLQIKRGSTLLQRTAPLLKMCLSNCIGQALIRGVKHIRSLDSHQRRPPRVSLYAAR